MKNWQFHQLKVGDIVFSSDFSRPAQVTDIHKTKGLICTEGQWKNYKSLHIYTDTHWPDSFTRMPKATHFYFSVPMLQRFTLKQAIFIQSIRRLGQEGFTGNTYTLCQFLPIYNTPHQVLSVIGFLERKAVLIRKELGDTEKAFHLTIDEEKIKEYL